MLGAMFRENSRDELRYEYSWHGKRSFYRLRTQVMFQLEQCPRVHTMVQPYLFYPCRPVASAHYGYSTLSLHSTKAYHMHPLN